MSQVMLTRVDREALRLEIDRRRRAQLAGERRQQQPRSAVARAVDFLEAELAAGPRPSSDVKARARAAGISANALRAARESAGVRCVNGGRTGSRWSLPGDPR
jgi:hypothetical protein